MGKSRSKKALTNTIAGFAHEFVTLICGLILPRLILHTFGSSYNGITSSITHFISCISLMKAGIGGVTKAALYKPLADNNTKEISEIVISTERFLRKVALIFLAGVFVFASLYPLWVKDFSWIFTFSLILIIAISTFLQYFFGLSYQMLLHADQMQGVTSVIQIISTILNTLIAALLIHFGATIHIVKLGSAFAFAFNPLLTSIYARKRYRIDRHVRPKENLLKQRWDALGHEVANFVNNNTDIMVLTVFSGIKTVSVYTVYAYVTNAIHKVVVNFVSSFGSAFGNMYARKEYELMHQNLGIFELIVFSICSVVYSVTLVMIRPFALLYTHGVTDISYNQPVFGILITLAGAFVCFRIPYYTITYAVGHFKQTRNGSFIEAIINIVVSIACVIKWGLVGVAIGTLCAATFRSCQYAYYLGKHILKRSIFIFAHHFLTALAIMAVTYLLGLTYIKDVSTVPLWIIKAVITTLIAVTLTLLTDVIFWRKDLTRFLTKIRGLIFKR